MSTENKPTRTVVELAKSSYQPTKEELNEKIDLGSDDLTPDDVANALLRPVEIRHTTRPNRRT